MEIPNDEDLEKIVESLNIMVIVLEDGRNVIGEYVSMEESGCIELFSVLTIEEMEDENGELGGYACMQPFTPLSMDTAFLFWPEHIVASANATEKLKAVYFNAMLAFTVREQESVPVVQETKKKAKGAFGAGDTQWGLGDSGNLSRN